jgi:hypothetical protein
MNFENNYASIDAAGFPKVVIAIKNHTPTKVEFEAFLDAMKKAYANGEDRVVLFDLVNARNVPISFQLKFGRWSKSMEPIFEKHLKGVTFQVSNKLIKGLLKFIFFFQPPNYEYQIFNDKAAVELHQKLLLQRIL